MIKDLTRTYLRLLIPAGFAFFCAYWIKRFDVIGIDPRSFAKILAAPVFILSAIFGIAVPVLLRTLFAHKNREATHTSESEWFLFERNLIRVALITPYVSLVGYYFDVPRFYMSGSFLFTLYAVYYFFPSNRRIAFERRIFRVK